MKIDLAVITQQPDSYFIEMLDKMTHQTVNINKIIIFNVEQKYFDRIIYSGRKFLDEHKNMEIHHVSKREYDCGKTRNSAVKCSDADYVLFMDQDAIPGDSSLLEKLVKKLESDPQTAVAYARQLSREDSTGDYKAFKSFLYPDSSGVKTGQDAEALGWMAYFSSNVCAAYNRSIFEELEGFGNHVITGEDVLYAAKAMHAGYKIAYVADANVVYSHRWDRDGMESFIFDMAVSHAKHPELFDSMAIRNLLKKEGKLAIARMKKSGNGKESMAAAARMRRCMKSYKLGLKFKRMSKNEILRHTANPEYWRADELMRDRSAINARLGYGRSEEEVAMLRQVPVMHKDEE